MSGLGREAASGQLSVAGRHVTIHPGHLSGTLTSERTSMRTYQM